jgi:hypothetical protein
MSGGPVLYTAKTDASFFMGWAGIIVRGGDNTERLNFFSSQYLIDLILHFPVRSANS